jgi:hypothetical protein
VEDVRKARAVQRYFDHADVDHNERLSWEEFVASVEAVHIEIKGWADHDTGIEALGSDTDSDDLAEEGE